MNDDKIDLSALDPARDRERWERRISEVVARAVLARRWTVSGQLSRWARPALALAAAAAMFSWVGVLVYAEPLEPSEMTSSETLAQQDPNAILSRWAANDEQPSAGSLLTVLGEE